MFLPHSVAWSPKKDSPKGTAANDGTAPSLTPGATLDSLVVPKTARWALEKYGVEVERQPFYAMFRYEDAKALVKGDLLSFNGEPLEVSMACQLHDYGDGMSFGETMLMGKRTGGRG